ncbi:MAG: glycoside hydrolase family 97 catalytic domain-containing protein, partial [Bacteroidales bacterium]|nr:glycoside hydrolase family 97 catalytic domain-containing protein [Bacteroidales bacterium]
MINNLADTAISGDFSWVKPGRSSWSWLTDNDSPKDFETMKKYVDLSAEMHWEYCLVDANWNLMQGGDIKQLVEYANSKNVGILMWYNSGGKHNKISERPRDIISNPEKCAAEFSKLQLWGVKGVKIDFWQSDKQNLIALYHDVLQKAAQHHLMVNLHGCTIPRGWSRTYPNLISQEAVKGEEAYLFDSSYPTNAPIQNSILPFTRNVIGSMDYTPVVFSDLNNHHLTTFAHELALALIFNSGITHFAGNVNDYNSLPLDVKQFLQNVPVVFDETHL